MASVTEDFQDFLPNAPVKLKRDREQPRSRGRRTNLTFVHLF